MLYNCLSKWWWTLLSSYCVWCPWLIVICERIVNYIKQCILQILWTKRSNFKNTENCREECLLTCFTKICKAVPTISKTKSTCATILARCARKYTEHSGTRQDYRVTEDLSAPKGIKQENATMRREKPACTVVKGCTWKPTRDSRREAPCQMQWVYESVKTKENPPEKKNA